MPFSILIFALVYIGVSSFFHTAKTREKTSEMSVRGILDPTDYRLHRYKWMEINHNWFHGDKSLVDEKWRDFLMHHHGGAWPDYRDAWISSEEFKAGYRPRFANWNTYDKRTYDPMGDFERKYGYALRVYKETGEIIRNY